MSSNQHEVITSSKDSSRKDRTLDEFDESIGVIYGRDCRNSITVDEAFEVVLEDLFGAE
jgi:hypothetical protein